MYIHVHDNVPYHTCYILGINTLFTCMCACTFTQETVAALMSPREEEETDPLDDNKPIDFSGGQATFDVS